jgi:hypothetical protein
MVKKGDEFKDMELYLRFRIEHLRLERQKVRFTLKESQIHMAHKKLDAKIEELHHTLKILKGDIKEASKFEWNKTKYLKEQKIEHIKKEVLSGEAKVYN